MELLDVLRNELPTQSLVPFESIVTQEVLGASNHIRMIGEMMEDIIEDSVSKNDSAVDMVARIRRLTDYFIQTRGEASQAISNAIYIMRKDFDKYDENISVEDLGARIISQKNEYKNYAQSAIDKTVENAVKMAEKYENIFVYDYSSTVEKFLSNLKAPVNVFIAESRIINGGQPFIDACLIAGHTVKFLPDSSMLYYLKDCDAAFMGAETFYPDGTGFNTTGSDIVAVLCDYLKIPLYFLTPMIKVDVRSVVGEYKETVMNDVSSILKPMVRGNESIDSLDFKVPELLPVAPKFISGFVTELGIIPSYAMYDVSMDYSRKIRGENIV